MEQTITFKLEDFEGPLDLLLYLVSKNKMNIYDIEIVALIDQYVSMVNGLPVYQMESASEFIEMAARLVQMKSYFLLPKSEEAERMKEELTGMLVEYSACKEVAAQLRSMAEGVYTVVREPAEVELDTEYRLRHDAYLLEEAYNALQGRSRQKQPPRQEQFEPLTTAPFVSVTSRIIHVLRGLMTGRVRRLRQLFVKEGGRSQTVATFLAVLELVRAGRIAIADDESLTVRTGIKMDLKQTKAAVEAMLFAHAEPVTAERLAGVLGVEEDAVSRLLLSLRDDYEAEDRGLVLLQLEDRWQLATKTAYAPYIKDIMDTRRNTPLSPAALEVLAIIAYNQPVSRSFIEQVRGVDSSSTVQTLVQKGLIEEAGRLDLPGRPVSFRTTDVFLRTFGIASLAELPPLHGDDYAEMEEAAGEAAYSGDEDADGAQAFAPEGDV